MPLGVPVKPQAGWTLGLMRVLGQDAADGLVDDLASLVEQVGDWFGCLDALPYGDGAGE
jgi:hypothetical protein